MATGSGVRPWVRLVAALGGAAAATWACSELVTALEPAVSAEGAGPALLWLNLTPVLIAVALLWAIGGRLVLALWCGGWLLWSLYAIDALKRTHLAQALVPGDLRLLPQLLGHPDLFSHYVGFDANALAMAVGVAAVAWALARHEPRTLPRWRWRAPLVLVPLSLGAWLLAGGTFWRTHYSDAALVEFGVWSPTGSITRAGLPAGLVRLGWETATRVPEPDAARLSQFEQDQATALSLRASRAAPQPLPDIVVVQFEALFDPARLSGIGPGEFMREFSALAARGVHGDMCVPTFGGATIRTEFEVLSGYPLSAFPSTKYPYYGLAMRPMQALPRRLQALGYRTLALHPFRRTFWNRDTALRQMGIERAVFENDPVFADAPRRGYYISDDALFEAVADALEDDGPPQLVLAITMENHGPWIDRRNIDAAARDAIAVPATLEGQAREELQTYLLHVEAGDRAFGRLARRLLARERPTLLLAYGDHLPGFVRVYDALGFDDGGAAPEQPVPYLLVSNRPLPAQRLDLESNLLAGLLVDRAGLPGDGYLAINARLRELMYERPLDDGQRVGLHELLQHAAWRDVAGDTPPSPQPPRLAQRID